VSLMIGTPDIGGSRASMALMAAETLGIDVAHIRTHIVDTDSIGYTFLTGGSRVTFATGMATVEAAKDAIQQLRARAAKIWEIPEDKVIWEDGCAKPAPGHASNQPPLSLAELAAAADVAERRRLGEEAAEAIELLVPEGSRCAGRPLSEIDFPPGTKAGAVVRPDGEVLVPDGDSVIHAGDRVVFFAQEQVVQRLESEVLAEEHRSKWLPR